VAGADVADAGGNRIRAYTPGYRLRFPISDCPKKFY